MPYNTGTDPTLTELITAKFIPETYSRDVMLHVKSNLVIGNEKVVTTKYRDDLKKGYKVNIAVFSEGATTEVTPGTVPTPVDSAGTPLSLTVDKWREITHQISDMEEVQQDPEYFQKAAESQGYAVQKYIDSQLGALFSALSSSSVYGSDGQTFTDSIFRALVQTLDEADVPEENRSLVGDPSMKSDLLDIDKFVSVDYVKTPVVPAGYFGALYNAKVLITNNLTAATTGNYGVLMHKEALGLVVQRTPRTRLIPYPQGFVTYLITDVIFGVGELRDTFGKSFYTRKS